jgi:hypothetical protein
MRKELSFMMITHSQALLVAETITMAEVTEVVARFLDLYQQEPERISIQGPATTVGRHPAQRIDLHAPVPVYAVRHNALQIEYLNERSWVKPAEGVWERLILEHHRSLDQYPSLKDGLHPVPLDGRTRVLVLALLDEVAIGSEHVYSITQTQSDETGVRCVLLFYEGRRTATLLIGASAPDEHERAQQSWKLEEEEEGKPGQ